MGVFKEHANAFETIEANQKRIYPDAADYGFPYFSGNPPKEIQTLIHYVNDLAGTSLMKGREEWGEKNKKECSVKIQIGWEVDEGDECGTEYIISFLRLCKNGNQFDKNSDCFISVHSHPYRIPYNH